MNEAGVGVGVNGGNGNSKGGEREAILNFYHLDIRSQMVRNEIRDTLGDRLRVSRDLRDWIMDLINRSAQDKEIMSRYHIQ